MTEQPSFNSERLAIARERRGLNKSQLAERADLAAKTIGAYERGVRSPDIDTTRRLAEILAFPVQFFLDSAGRNVSPDSASFRSMSKMTARQRHAAVAVGEIGVLVNNWVEQNFEVPDPDVPEVRTRTVDPTSAAAIVRAAWGLGEAPISNVLHLLEQRGVRIFSLDSEWKEVDAYSFWSEGTPYVCVSHHKTAERGVFDAAHELGHLVLHRDHTIPRGRDLEKEADEFASSFLMPAEDVKAHLPLNATLDDLVAVKHRWRVSVAALNYRASTLGWSTEWHARSVFIQLARIGRATEIDPLQHETSQLLEKVFGALHEEGVGISSLADELGIDARDLSAVTFGQADVLRGARDRRRGHLTLLG